MHSVKRSGGFALHDRSFIFPADVAERRRWRDITNSQLPGKLTARTSDPGRAEAGCWYDDFTLRESSRRRVWGISWNALKDTEGRGMAPNNRACVAPLNVV